MDQVTIVIVNYEGQADTRECLTSLLEIKHTQFQFNVLVVDNGSIQAFKLPRSLTKKNIEVVRSQANLGFTGGNNLGIWYARENYNPDYILLLNNDTTVEPMFLEEMIQFSKDHLDVGLIGSKIYFSKGREFHSETYAPSDRGKVIWFAGGSIDWPNLVAFHRGVDEVDRGQFDQSIQTDFITGCSLLIPRTVFEKIGGLNKDYFLYLEDVDYCLRAQQAGFKLGICPESVVWHKNAGSSGGAGSETSVYYQTRNRLYFALKYAHWYYKFTAVRLALQKLLFGTRVERKAVVDLMIGNMGKQPII